MRWCQACRSSHLIPCFVGALGLAHQGGLGEAAGRLIEEAGRPRLCWEIVNRDNDDLKSPMLETPRHDDGDSVCIGNVDLA